MARVKKAPDTKGADDGLPEKNGSNDSHGTLSPAVAAHVAAVVAADPRGAPITLPDDNPTTLMEDAMNGPIDPLDDTSAFAPQAELAPEVAPDVPIGPRCALEDAPVNSHLVILQWPGEKADVVLQTPKGREEVPADDLAWKLPIMAELKKTGPHTYVAIQRDDQNGMPKLVCATAVEACQKFRKHFHGERD